MTEHPPAPRAVAQLPDGTWVYSDQAPVAPAAAPAPQIVHVHAAPPDRTVQRVALGAGIGGGATAGAVYFGPLLVAALSSMAITLAVTALVIAVTAWGVVSVVRSVGGPEGQAAAKAIGQARKGGRR